MLHASVVHCFSDFLGDYSQHPELVIFYLELMQYALYILYTVKKRDVLFIMGDWNAKVGSQEILGVTGNIGLEVKNEAGQRLTEFCQEKMLVIPASSKNTRDDPTHGHHQMVIPEIRLIICFVAEDGGALYNRQKQDQEWTVARIMNSLLEKSDLN